MNLSIRKSILSGRWTPGILVVVGASALGLMFPACGPSRSKRLARDVDQQTREAYDGYARKPFEEATNTLTRYIDLLERTPDKVQAYRDVDLLVYIARAKLGYMLLCAGQVDCAYTELSLAYERHKRVQRKARMQPVPRSEFVNFVITGFEKVDAKTGVVWKSAYSLKQDSVQALNARFASNALAPVHDRN